MTGVAVQPRRPSSTSVPSLSGSAVPDLSGSDGHRRPHSGCEYGIFGFPMLASILVQNRFLPRQLQTRGNRLVFSNGIVLLAASATGLIMAFDDNIDPLIQLYVIGVVTSSPRCTCPRCARWPSPVVFARTRSRLSRQCG